jgi:hypothetical protein
MRRIGREREINLGAPLGRVPNCDFQWSVSRFRCIGRFTERRSILRPALVGFIGKGLKEINSASRPERSDEGSASVVFSVFAVLSVIPEGNLLFYVRLKKSRFPSGMTERKAKAEKKCSGTAKAESQQYLSSNT